MKKYRLMVSKGFVAVEWNDEVVIEAKDEKEAKRIALTMAKKDMIEWQSSNYDDSNANFQVEECEEESK
tara:strand:- start:267 stop:473 length:207 start_codon:yes stop_codon:yes gene_type:complete